MSETPPRSSPDPGKLNGLLTQLQDAAAQFSASFGAAPVAPLGPLAPSPMLAGETAGVPTNLPVRTTPFRRPGAAVPPRAETHSAEAPAVAPAPAAPPPRARPLRPLWIDNKEAPTERFSTDGQTQVAYERSHDTDACGAPLWSRIALPFSALAEAKLAEYLGMGPVVATMAAALVQIAEDAAAGRSSAIAKNVLIRFGIIDGASAPVPPTAKVAPRPMPKDGSTVDANVVAVQHPACCLLVVTSEHAPRVGDVVERWTPDGLAFDGRIARVFAKDQGFDLLVAIRYGVPVEGRFTMRRPVGDSAEG